ncbi:MAG: phosphoribosylamine--glycine ligase [Nitrospirota bacterium]
MKILMIGSGGREHTLIWKISLNPMIEKIYCANGNGGISQLAECIDIRPDEIDSLLSFAKDNSIDITVAGPELPLTLGIVDRFEEEGMRIFGPSKKAVEIESSKAFAKELMKKYNIPTGDADIFTSEDKAIAYIREKAFPIVIKADGLAAGKGVIIAYSQQEAIETVRSIMGEKIFGDAGQKIVIEEYIDGEEATFMAFTDGDTVIPMVSSQDHKRVYDGDKGPNTGGMGAYSPAPVITEELEKRIMDEIIVPIINGLSREERKYKGVIYAGLMIKGDAIKVLEFNARFGDPEAQVILPRLKTDIIEIMEAIIEERLKEIEIKWREDSTICIVMSSAGYPGRYTKGKTITGIEDIQMEKDIIVFHAGTALKEGKFITDGGRVLGITATGSDLRDAIEKGYHAAGKIRFDGMHFRRDIGVKGLCKAGR